MRAGAAVCLVALGACKLGASFDDGRFRCSDTSPCPTGRVCLDGYCELDGVPSDAGQDDLALLGDVLMLTFDDIGLPSARDRSGHRFDCSGGGVSFDQGVYGAGAHMMPNNFLVVPDQPELFLDRQLTIEAWIRREAAGVLFPVFGDRSVDPQDVAAEYSLEVTAEDRLLFVTNSGCLAGAGERASSDMAVPAGKWVHVAVAWDGAEARFYLDGAAAGTVSLTAAPCELSRSPRIGRLQGDNTLMTVVGAIDELKVSSAAKSEADIAASMAYDSTALQARCGDLIVESEGCDGDSPCCDATRCELAADDTACEGDTCQLGVCAVGGDRVTEALVALYYFDEGSGSMVIDSSGVAPQLNLVIMTPGDVIWSDGALTIDKPTVVASSTATSKITEPCRDSGEVTLEAWVEPANVDQSGQIVAIGDGNASNIALGQYGTSYNGRARSSGTASRGTPHVSSAIGDVAGALTHVVMRREADGTRTLFIDGRERGINRAPGSLSGWNAVPLALGDEATAGDSWLGRYHLVAMYCRALTDREVAANYNAGPDPDEDD